MAQGLHVSCMQSLLCIALKRSLKVMYAASSTFVPLQLTCRGCSHLSHSGLPRGSWGPASATLWSRDAASSRHPCTTKVCFTAPALRPVTLMSLLQDTSPARKQQDAELQLRATRFPSAYQTSAPAQTRLPCPRWLSAAAGLSRTLQTVQTDSKTVQHCTVSLLTHGAKLGAM